jgi:hypothetical protein
LLQIVAVSALDCSMEALMRTPLRIFLWAMVVAFSLTRAHSQQASSLGTDHKAARNQNK